MQTLAQIPPVRLILRCYVRRAGRRPDRWVAHCVDWDLWAVGPTPDKARASLENAITGYARAVFDTDDRASIPALLGRRAPLRHVAVWHLLRIASKLTGDGPMPLGSHPFQEMPFVVAPA